jgi:predicted transposase/invertase (TIGR01784 family)
MQKCNEYVNVFVVKLQFPFKFGMKSKIIHFVPLDLKIREISLKNPFSQRSEEEKLSILDVFCQDEKNNQFIVEVQKARLAVFEKRIQYYGSKYYSDQINVGEDYTELIPVYVVIIVDFTMFDREIPCVSHHETKEVTTGRTILKDIKYTIIELPKFVAHEELSVQDQWIYLLTNYERGPPEKSISEIEDAFGILEMSKWKVEDKVAYEKRVLEEAEAKLKINYAREEGIGIGIEIGKQEGREEGIEIGVERGKEQGIQEGIRNAYQTLTQDIDALARTFNKDPNEIRQILGLQ